MSYFTGMRIGKILGLTWDRVHLREGFLELKGTDTKTGKPRRVFLADEVITALRELAKVHSITGHVFLFREKAAERHSEGGGRGLQSGWNKKLHHP